MPARRAYRVASAISLGSISSMTSVSSSYSLSSSDTSSVSSSDGSPPNHFCDVDWTSLLSPSNQSSASTLSTPQISPTNPHIRTQPTHIDSRMKPPAAPSLASAWCQPRRDAVSLAACAASRRSSISLDLWPSPSPTCAALAVARREQQIERLARAFVMSDTIQLGLRTQCPNSLDAPKLNAVSFIQVFGDSEIPRLPMPQLFASVCITDSNIPGNAIKFHSAAFRLGPRGLNVGACMFLNLPSGNRQGVGVDVFMGDDGRLRFVLEIAMRCVSVGRRARGRGRGELLLASQVDVTEAVRGIVGSWVDEGAEEEGGDFGAGESEGSMGDGERLTYCYLPRPYDPSGTNTETVATDFTWLDLSDAEIEAAAASPVANTCLSPTELSQIFAASEHPVRSETTAFAQPTGVTSDALAFLRLCREIQSDHHDFLVFAPSPSPSEFSTPALVGYIIRYASPSLSSHADLRANFGHTAPEVLRELANMLQSGIDAGTDVRWGVEGEEKWSKWVRVGDGRSGWWVCFLV
ncbi:hypothetical protein H2201_008058 [Coniosporium apollinis]|uniref:Ornithine decarboxylase antizyme n=2 Tax=Coniosporium TaxID=2810619 RepID=A0ABQ9NJ64_9PEZI|nr:hypothetical protein H2199_002407 [Cladosporium sp. JES 115]KAJ9657745.1 hypothetical protein H2201_008058 [Coniosporium apollinis]